MHELIHPAGIDTPVRTTFRPARKWPYNNVIRKLSILIPVYNEASTIAVLLDKVIGVDLINNIEKEILIVNDYSKDGTDDVIKDYILKHPQAEIQYFSHDTNRGKGAAIHTGIRHASGDYLLIQDADLEYDPDDYNALLRPVVKGQADVVYGSRFIGGNPHRVLFFWHTIGNRFLTFLSNMSCNLNLTDMETGYKLFRTSLIQQIQLKEQRFGIEPEITAKIARVRGARIYEVGISYYGRTYQEGKKIRWRDGVRAIFCILKYGFFARKAINIPVHEVNMASAY